MYPTPNVASGGMGPVVKGTPFSVGGGLKSRAVPNTPLGVTSMRKCSGRA